MPRPDVPNGFPRQCPICDHKWIASGNRAIYCSTACRVWANSGGGKSARSNTCPTCGGQTRQYRGAKYCSKECMPSTRPDGRAATAPLVMRKRTVRCDFCSTEFKTTKTLQRYCSKWCSDTAYGEPGTFADRVGRNCGYCANEIPTTARLNKFFCSASCQNKNNQQARRARRRGLPAEDINRISIFERDCWICHLCNKAIDKTITGRHPMAASLDHIVPLADPQSPGHVESNVAASHLRCNMSKGAGALVGRHS